MTEPGELRQSMGRPARILVGHSYWGRGGAEVVGMWIIRALCHDFEVHVISRGGWNLPALNDLAGTDVPAGRVHEARLPLRHVLALTKGGALWNGVFRRQCRRLAVDYDLCITVSRIIDWGVPAIHFLSDVAWNDALREKFCGDELESRVGWIQKRLSSMGRWLAGHSGRNPAQDDVFVANSNWNADISAPYCGRRPIVIYPAVPESHVGGVFADREKSFLCIGRISPEKRLEAVIEILDAVRNRGFAVRLRLVGAFDDTIYARQIRALCAARSEWITVYGALFARDKAAILALCRYGISACEREAFGIATAEMVCAGALPFVPAAGAQSEVVGESDLVYESTEDAVEKIVAVLESDEREQKLHARMLLRAEQFRSERFCKQVASIVRQAVGAHS